MNKNLNTVAKLAAIAGAFALAGCAFVPDTVHPQYVPQANVQKIPGADKVAVQVIVKNEKKHKEQVSSTIDVYGISTSEVTMHIKKDFTNAISKALKARGFQVLGSSGSTVLVDIQHFYFHAHSEVIGTSDTGTASMLVSVRRNGNTLFSNKFTLKNYSYSSVSVFGGENRHYSSEHMLDKLVNRMVNDHQFIDALLESGQAAALHKLN